MRPALKSLRARRMSAFAGRSQSSSSGRRAGAGGPPAAGRGRRRALALAQGGGDGGHGSLHFRAVYARRGAALFQGSGVGGQCGLHAGAALVQRLAQHVQLVQFLLGERPASFLPRGRVFLRCPDRPARARASSSGGQPQALAQALGRGSSQSSVALRSVFQILRPLITPSDSTLCAGSRPMSCCTSPASCVASTCSPATGRLAARYLLSSSGPN